MSGAGDVDDDVEEEEEDGKMIPNTIPKMNIPIIPTNISRGESFVDDNNDVLKQQDFSFPSRSFSSGLLLVVLSLSL